MVLTTSFLSCLEEKGEDLIQNSDSKDYFETLQEHVVIQMSSATIEGCKDVLYKTRSAERVMYTLTAKSTLEDLSVVTCLYIEKTDAGYLFEHYTEDDIFLGSIECDRNLGVLNIEAGDDVGTRGLRSWWACTQYEYAKAKKDLEKNKDESMILDVLCDGLPCKAVSAAASGLYCMGLH